jgi:hypothetical protein
MNAFDLVLSPSKILGVTVPSGPPLPTSLSRLLLRRVTCLLTFRVCDQFDHGVVVYKSTMVLFV